MTKTVWIGQDGDWNDPINWSTGAVPETSDVATFSLGNAATIEGSAYIGEIVLSGADLTISGDIGSDGRVTSAIIDDSASTGTLTLEPWAVVSLGSLSLGTTFLNEQGTLLTEQATVSSVLVDGVSAQWLTSQATITGTLAVKDGANLFGNLLLASGSNVIIDSFSNISNGSITATGNCSFEFVGAPGATGIQNAVRDSVFVSSGATLTLLSQNGSPVILSGEESGPGEISINNGSLAFALQPASVTKRATQVSGSAAATSNFTIVNSSLDLRNQVTSSLHETNVRMNGTQDTVFGGSQNIHINVVTSIMSTITLASGDATVFASSGAFSIKGGTGNLTAYGKDDADTLVGGSGSNTLVGGSGSYITATGAGLNVIGTSGSGAFLDASSTSGVAELFSTNGSAVTTMVGGSGTDVFLVPQGSANIMCGEGENSVWSGNAVATTVVGGLGNNVIQSGVSARVSLSGPGSNVEISGSASTTVQASSTTGSLVLFALNSDSVSVSAGSGELIALVQSSAVSVSGAHSSSVIWCLDRADVTLDGADSATVVLAGASDTINASATSGTNVIGLSNCSSPLIQLSAGNNEVVCDSSNATIIMSGGSDVIFAGSGNLDLVYHDVASNVKSVILNFDSSHDTLSFGSAAVVATQTSYGLELSSGGASILLYHFSGHISGI